MARLESLIKVKKHAVDEKQRFLAELYRQQESLKNMKDQLLMALAREQALVDADITNLDARTWFGRYAAGVHQRIADLDEMMRKLETRIIVATDEVRIAFAEMKKIEITDRTRAEREQKEMDHRVAQELDDIGIEIFRRQGDDQSSS